MERKPGNQILDRYMAGASPEELAEARGNLNKLAHAYLRVIARLVAEGKGELLKQRARENDIVEKTQET